MVLTLLDFDQIKAFIYAAPMLRAIRGSSSMLAEFNNSKHVEQRVSKAGGTFIYAGGGSVLAQFASQEGAEAFVASEKKKLAQVTCGSATFTAVIEEVNTQLNPGEAFLQAQRSLLQAKARRVHTDQIPHHFLFKPCQACTNRPAVTRNTQRGLLVCLTCNERIKRGSLPGSNRQQLLEAFRARVGEAWKDVEEAADLETLGKVSGNYIGLIQADGNAMGERLHYVAKSGDMVLFTEFSATCRQVTEDALCEALRDAYPAPSRDEQKKIFPFELVIAGGDDVTIITTADRAIQVAVEFCDRFTERMQDWAKTQGHYPKLAVGMSAGVVFARSSHPIVLLDELAGQLLKSAKLRSRQLGREVLTPTIDFMAVRASTAEDLKTVRSLYTRKEESLRLTQRPYTTCELRRLLGALKHMQYPPDGIQPFPRSKLHDLYDIPFKSYEKAELDYLYLRGRLDNSHRCMLRKLAEAGGIVKWTPLSRQFFDEIKVASCR